MQSINIYSFALLIVHESKSDYDAFASLYYALAIYVLAYFKGVFVTMYTCIHACIYIELQNSVIQHQMLLILHVYLLCIQKIVCLAT